jgi:GNAT superfamily N-acetyltransferase
VYEVVVPLTVRDLTEADLPRLGEPPTKVVAMRKELERVQLGEADYLAVCTPFGAACGVGTVLIHALEERIRARGLPFAELGVDDASPRPQRLYERLGYVVSGSETGSWDVDAPDGSVIRYEATITLLRKQL